MNIKLVSRYIGIALLFDALFMFLSLLVSIFYGFDEAFSPLLISTFILLIIGIFPLIFVNRAEDISLKDGFAITFFSWLLSCIFGMFPYVLYGGEFTLVNAFFESVSGFTTTGGTILCDIEAVPKSLLFWRSSTHFIGGIGVVIFMLLVLPTMSTFRMRMSRMEISSLSKDNYKFKTKETIKVITTIYLGITILCTISLLFAGMDFFDAINHSFSIVSTGGFSTNNLSILGFHSYSIELVCMFFMIVSGLHFGLMYSSIKTRTLKVFKSPIIKFFLASVCISSILTAISIKFAGIASTWPQALHLAFFQCISISTTTGFATADTSIWPSFAIFVLIYMSFQGACSGSTTGGVKADRIWIFLKNVKRHINKQLHPNAVIPIKVGNHKIDVDFASSVTLFLTFYIFITFFVAILISTTGLSLIESFSASLASISNVGPGFSTLGSLSNFNHLSSVAKFLLSIEMLLGRLEIYPFLLIFMLFKKG